MSASDSSEESLPLLGGDKPPRRTHPEPPSSIIGDEELREETEDSLGPEVSQKLCLYLD